MVVYKIISTAITVVRLYMDVDNSRLRNYMLKVGWETSYVDINDSELRDSTLTTVTMGLKTVCWHRSQWGIDMWNKILLDAKLRLKTQVTASQYFWNVGNTQLGACKVCHSRPSYHSV